MDLLTQLGKEKVGQMEKVALTYIHYYGKKIVGEKLLYNTGNPAWHFGMTSRGGMREARPNREGTHV